MSDDELNYDNCAEFEQADDLGDYSYHIRGTYVDFEPDPILNIENPIPDSDDSSASEG